MTQVVLVFPPLVSLNFGGYYPSTAVLAGFLGSRGITTKQRDLNEEFAEFLATDPMLELLGHEDVLGAPSDSIPAALVRWVGNSRARLFDERGRHLFGGPERSVLELLAAPFLVDPSAALLESISRSTPSLSVYWDFFEWCGIADEIAGDVTLVGLSVPMGPQLAPALALAKYLKDRRPDVPIVLGGPTFSLMSPDVIEAVLRRHVAVDCVVQSDGEYPLLELSRQALEGSWNPAAVPGVSTVLGGAFVSVSPIAGPDLNDLPPPEYDAEILARLTVPILGVTQARGCYWGKCEFCDHVNVHAGNRTLRTRRPENFVNDIEHIVARTGISRFRVITEALPPAFARRISELILARGLQIKWNSFAMVDRHLDRDLLALMVEAGCEYLVVGVETMNTRILNLVRKPSDREQSIQFLHDAREVGMKVVINLIPDLPTTTYEEAMASLADVGELRDCFETVSVFPFETTRSSNVGRHPERFGLEVTASSAQRGAAQFELNRLDVNDPAMGAELRAEVLARYVKFANDHATQKRSRFLDLAASEDRLVRVPTESVDIFPRENGLVCTQVLTRKALALSRAAAAALEPFLTGEPFRWSQMRTQIGERKAEALREGLEKTGLVVMVESS
jgi:Radical SAM superfamily/B12 binding domain